MSTVFFHNPDVPFRYYLIIPHTDLSEYRILLRKTPKGWTLPSYVPYEHHFGVVNHINQHVWEEYGLSVATLRCLQTEYSREEGERRFYALDNLHPSWQPPEDMQWFTEQEVTFLKLSSQLELTMIMHWFNWMHSDSSLRPDWMRSGWLPQAARWMMDLAERMEMEGLITVQQLRAWSRSSTVRLHTEKGNLYLKAVPQMFNYEPIITRVISIRYPDHAPEVMAVHVENSWMLMHDFKGRPLRGITDIDVWKRVLKRYAELQIDLAPSSQSLIGLGVPDRNVDYLCTQIERLMKDLPEALSDDESFELRRLAPTLRSLCYQLTEHRIPQTLTHGDMWSSNIIIRENGNCLFFDWSDASISFPFFDIPFFLSEIEMELPDVPDAREQLRDAYLQPWTRYEPMSHLRRAYEISEVLGALHQALIYHSHILPGIEANARWEMQNMLPMLLRQVIAATRLFQF